MNTGRTAQSMNIGVEEYNHVRLLFALQHELEVVREDIRSEFAKRKLFPLTKESANIREDPALQNLTEKAISILQRLESDAKDLLKEAAKATISPYCSDAHVRSVVNSHVRPISHAVKKLLHSIGTILTAHKRYLDQRKEQEKTALTECGKVLTMEMEPWDGVQSYIFYMVRFLQSQEFIADERARFLRLERAMSKVERARRIISYFTNSRHYDRALRELNSVFGKTRDAWSDAIKVFERLPSQVKSLREIRALHAAIRSLRSYLDIFYPLNEFLNDSFIIRTVFYRLVPIEQEKLVKRKKKFDAKRREEAFYNGQPPPDDCSYVFFILEIYNKEYIAFDREMSCLQDSAKQDIVSSHNLSRQQITGSQIKDSRGDRPKNVSNNASNSTLHQQQPRKLSLIHI